MHIPHLEDLILHNGNPQRTFDIIKGLNYSELPVSIKWDGAPAIVAGINPENNKFFVGTKSVFSKSNRKICYDFNDIGNLFPWEHCADLRTKLKLALTYLPELNIDGVFQGDFLFSHLDKTSTFTSDYTEFTPNTITYRVPCMLNQAIGFALHTRYIGSTMDSLVPIYNSKVPDSHRSPNIWLVDGSFDNRIEPISTVDNMLGSANHMVLQMSIDFLDDIAHKPKLARSLYDFVCFKVKSGGCLDDSYQQTRDYIDWVKSSFHHNPVVLAYASIRRGEFCEYLDKNEHNINFLFRYFAAIRVCKRYLIDDLQKNSKVQTFLNGKKSTHEGFVVDGVKLVNRDQFTHHNHIKHSKELVHGR